MIPYLIGAGIGYIIAELVNEEKIEKLKAQQQTITPVVVEETQTSAETNDGEAEEETKKVEFVAKSRGKKKPE